MRKAGVAVLLALVGALTCFAAVALASPRVPQTTGWRSNLWQNPTGSIVCRYSPQMTTITCTSQRSGLSVRLGQDGPVLDIGTARLVRVWTVRKPSAQYVPVLGYGVRWKSDEFVCIALLAGVTCRIDPGLRQLMGNHGFSLNRHRARRW